MYYYESHLGGYYASDRKESFDNLYCEQCGDSDFLLGWYETDEDFFKSLIETEHHLAYDLGLLEWDDEDDEVGDKVGDKVGE